MEYAYVPCTNCGKLNRAAWEESASKEPICGNCKSRLPLHFGVAEVSGSGLKTLSEKSPIPVVCDFWASWCGPCRQSFPWMNDLQRLFPNRDVVVLADNLDKDRALADRLD